MERKPYPSDFKRYPMAIDRTMISLPKPGGRPRTVTIREGANAIFHILRGGCAWRMPPHEFPPWQTVYYYFAQWRKILNMFHVKLNLLFPGFTSIYGFICCSGICNIHVSVRSHHVPDASRTEASFVCSPVEACDEGGKRCRIE